MAYIIDRYNSWDQWDRQQSVYKFEINEQWYAVKEVELEWGLPQLPIRIDSDQNPSSYHIYGTMEEAIEFAKLMKHIN